MHILSYFPPVKPVSGDSQDINRTHRQRRNLHSCCVGAERREVSGGKPKERSIVGAFFLHGVSLSLFLRLSFVLSSLLSPNWLSLHTFMCADTVVCIVHTHTHTSHFSFYGHNWTHRLWILEATRAHTDGEHKKVNSIRIWSLCFLEIS